MTDDLEQAIRNMIADELRGKAMKERMNRSLSWIEQATTTGEKA